MQKLIGISLVLLLLLDCQAGSLSAEDDPLRERALAAMRKAAEFYRGKVAYRGGYVYYYSPDLTRRLGEGVAGPHQIWVQPPGTPTVGLAYLAAWRATGDKFYLDAAREAGEGLMYGQFESGGWTNAVEILPDAVRPAKRREGNSTLDDGISQSVIRLLAQLDQALGFKDAAVHESAQLAIRGLLQAQFACGAFPQVWRGPVPEVPVMKASYPPYDWRTEGRIKNYWDMYTLNDGLAGTVTKSLLDVHAIYQDDQSRSALAKLGDFLILAQMPQPQPGWAQQYSYDMHPIWARKFEPPAVTGGESQDVLETLLKIYEVSGDKKYLAPIPPALAYLKRSLLPDGRLARYYELQNNKPLYMSRKGDTYSLTNDDSQLPDHYGWKVVSRLPAIEAAYQAAMAGRGARSQDSGIGSQNTDAVRKIIADLDAQGRWISKYAGEPLYGQPKFKPGEEFIGSHVFSKNLETLSSYGGAKR